MHPRVGRHGKHRQVKGRRRLDQAGGRTRRVLALSLALLAAGCSGGVPKDADPRYWWRNLSGAYLDGREPPPGRDAPYPNLSTVPARPVPPSAAARAALTNALAADRSGARDGLVIAPVPGSAEPATTRPPAPPRLAALPPIRFDPLPETPLSETPPPATSAQPGATPSGLPSAPPAGPRSGPLSGPPAAPSRDLLAPPRAADPGLSGPPPAPSSDLLAPRRN